MILGTIRTATSKHAIDKTAGLPAAGKSFIYFFAVDLLLPATPEDVQDWTTASEPTFDKVARSI